MSTTRLYPFTTPLTAIAYVARGNRHSITRLNPPSPPPAPPFISRLKLAKAIEWPSATPPRRRLPHDLDHRRLSNRPRRLPRRLGRRLFHRRLVPRLVIRLVVSLVASVVASPVASPSASLTAELENQLTAKATAKEAINNCSRGMDLRKKYRAKKGLAQAYQ